MPNSWNMRQGLNAVGAYQVSGAPYATSSIDGTNATLIDFPYVTRWFKVNNHTTAIAKLGFSQNGIGETAYDGYGGYNYIIVPASGSNGPGTTGILEIKVGQLWVVGSSNVEVIAGLTSIQTRSTQGSAGSSWSGSSGVG